MSRFFTVTALVASAIVALYTALTGGLPADPGMSATPTETTAAYTEGTVTIDGHTYDYGISAVPLPPEYRIDEAEPLTPQH